MWFKAAKYLNIKNLLDMTYQTIANLIKGKTSDEIYKNFKIKNYVNPKQEEDVRRENAWAFE